MVWQPLCVCVLWWFSCVFAVGGFHVCLLCVCHGSFHVYVCALLYLSLHCHVWYGKVYVTGFAKTVPNGTRIEIQFIA